MTLAPNTKTFLIFFIAALIAVPCWMVLRTYISPTIDTNTFYRYIWHYRMTVTIATPEGLKSGSAVREVTFQKGLHILPEMQPFIELKGEAVSIDLGERGILFATLMGGTENHDHAANIFLQKFPDKEKLGEVSLSAFDYPKFVYFKDPKDFKSVETVFGLDSSGKLIDRMEEILGKGVRIEKITLQVTDDPITRNLGEIPSTAPESGYPEWFRKLRYGDSRRLGLYDFKTGIK